MRRLSKVGKMAMAVSVVLSLLVSCGGSGSGSSAGEGKPLGKVPGYFVEMAQKQEELDQKLREERDMDRYQKKLKEYDEYVAKTCEKAAEEGQKLVESLDGVEAMWCTPDKQATTSSGWDSHLKK